MASAILYKFSSLNVASGPQPPAKAYSSSKRRIVLVGVLIAVIAALDLCFQRTNFSILYIAPLLLLARRRDLRHPWPTAGLLIGLTFGIYFLKNVIWPLEGGPKFFDYRLFNRTLVGTILLVLTWMTAMWRQWQAEQSDAELPEMIRYQDRQVSATLAVVSCAALVATIGIVDYFLPANFNLAILYTIPLFACAWSGSTRLLWGVAALLLVLTTAGYLLGGASYSPDAATAASLTRNRLLAAAAIVVLSAVLTFWMGQRDDQTSV